MNAPSTKRASSHPTPEQRSWRRGVWHAFIRARLPFKRTLVRIYLRALERRRSARVDPDERASADGLAIPPPRLRVLVSGTSEVDSFLRSGRSQTDYLRDLLLEWGRPLEEMRAILEFGCGCGRMTRWWSALRGPDVHACDYNGELVDWVQENLLFTRATRNDPKPPLPYPDASIDFIYAFSVFTHLSPGLTSAWLAEFRRVLRPGGLAWFTLHGEAYRDRLPERERLRFDAGEVVLWLPEVEGTNLCASYWPDRAVADVLAEDFELVAHLDPLADPILSQSAQIAPHDSYLISRR